MGHGVSSYIRLPEQIAKKHACVNIKNYDDDACFAWSIVSALYTVNNHVDRTSSYQHYSQVLNENFPEEIALLNSNKDLNTKNKLLRLSPFIDPLHGLLRVGGRLRNSSLRFEEKHPLLLSKNHILTRLIFEQIHLELLHPGPQLLLATVRQKYWVTSGMNVSKKITRNCIRCFKFKPKFINPIMAQLPKDRVTLTSPFYISGVDYAGPFFLKDKKRRGAKPMKGYVCLFICFSVKAIHLELVTELTTESFIAALRRFTARRGKPGHIYSDNATNFGGAVKELNILHDFFVNSNDEIVRNCAVENIVWHFISPNSPHFGEIWESGVKSVKHHLLIVIKDTMLTYEEFNTVLIQVEGILNSRPLHPLSPDPNDLQPVTPTHFLTEKSLLTVPDPNVMELPVGKLSRFQLIQQISQSFWKRWSRDCLAQLQQRTKWYQNSSSLQVGSLVLNKQDNLPPCQWLLARVIQLHPGEDNVVRVVTVKTQKWVLKRVVANLCPLPLPEIPSEVK